MTDAALSRRNKASRRRGAQWQTDIRNTLREQGFDVEILELSGVEDEGDLVIRLRDGRYVIVEAKNEASINLPQYLREARAEATNFANHRPAVKGENVLPVAIVKARGKSIQEAYVVTRFEDYFTELSWQEQGGSS